MKKIQFKDVAQYINSFPDDVKDVLEKLRKLIKEEAPHADLVISYNIPSFKIDGKYFIYFAGYEKHVSLYPIIPDEFPFEQEVAKYASGKGTVQFKLEEPIPYDLIKKMVKFKLQKVK